MGGEPALGAGVLGPSLQGEEIEARERRHQSCSGLGRACVEKTVVQSAGCQPGRS